MRRRWSADADHPHLVGRAGSGRRGLGTLSLGLRRMVASGPPGARTSLALADGQPPLTHDLRPDRSTYLTRNRTTASRTRPASPCSRWLCLARARRPTSPAYGDRRWYARPARRGAVGRRFGRRAPVVPRSLAESRVGGQSI